jgi:hypothetical protein
MAPNEIPQNVTLIGEVWARENDAFLNCSEKRGGKRGRKNVGIKTTNV